MYIEQLLEADMQAHDCRLSGLARGFGGGGSGLRNHHGVSEKGINCIVVVVAVAVFVAQELENSHSEQIKQLFSSLNTRLLFFLDATSCMCDTPFD